MITAELPGVDPAAVEISFENNTLTLRGTKAPWLVSRRRTRSCASTRLSD